MRKFCIYVLPKDDGRDVVVREVEPCEARAHMTIDELETFIASESYYTATEKLQLVDQLQQIRYSHQAMGVR